MKAVAERLLKVVIYPSTDEFRDITRDYMEECHEDFLKRFKKPQWSAYYVKNIYTPVSLRNLHNLCIISHNNYDLFIY